MDYLKIKENVLKTLEGYEAFAQKYGTDEDVKSVKKLATFVREDKLVIMDMGEARRGKSSMLGQYLGDEQLFPVDVDVTTCTVTMVMYGPRERIQIVMTDKAGKEYKREVAKKDLELYVKEQMRDRLDGAVKMVLVETPNPKLKEGIVLIDSPGLGSMNPEHSRITFQFLPRADVVLFVLNSTVPITDSELDFLKQAARKCSNIIFVMTMIDIVGGEYKRIMEKNREFIEKAVGIPKNEQIFVPISSRMMQSWRRTGDPDDLDDSHFNELDEMIQRTVALNRPRIVLRPCMQAVRDELGKYENLIRVEETAYLNSIEEAERMQKELEQKQERHRMLLQENAGWMDTVRSSIQDLDDELENTLADFVQEVSDTIEMRLAGTADQKNPQPLINEVITSCDMQINLMSEKVRDTVDQLLFDLKTQSGLDFTTLNRTPMFSANSLNAVELKKRKAGQRVMSAGQTMTRGRIAISMLGGVIGGVVGGVAGFMVAGPAGAYVGASSGATYGTALAGAAGIATGVVQAVKTDTGYDIPQLKKDLNSRLRNLFNAWKREKKSFLRKIMEDIRNDMKKTILDEIEELKKSIELLKKGSKGMSSDELKRKQQRIAAFRAQYEELKAAVDELWEQTSMDGEADNLSWGFEQEKVSRRRQVIAEAESQSLPLDD